MRFTVPAIVIVLALTTGIAAGGRLEAQVCGFTLSCSQTTPGFFVSNSNGAAIQGEATGSSAWGSWGPAAPRPALRSRGRP